MNYNVGDEATIVKRIHGHGLEIGEIVKITRVGIKTYHVRSLNDWIDWGVTDEEIKMLIPENGTNREYAQMVLDETD